MKDSGAPGRRSSTLPPGGRAFFPIEQQMRERRMTAYCRYRARDFGKTLAWALACALYPRERGDVSGPEA